MDSKEDEQTQTVSAADTKDVKRREHLRMGV